MSKAPNQLSYPPPPITLINCLAHDPRQVETLPHAEISHPQEEESTSSPQEGEATAAITALPLEGETETAAAAPIVHDTEETPAQESSITTGGEGGDDDATHDVSGDVAAASSSNAPATTGSKIFPKGRGRPKKQPGTGAASVSVGGKESSSL
jgi:hypothetical protein